MSDCCKVQPSKAGTIPGSLIVTDTQLPSDTNLIASGLLPYSVILMDANTTNFNKKGTLCVNNAGSSILTLAPVNGQLVNGGSAFQIAPGDTSCIRATVVDSVAGGASWIVVPAN